jgi:hypothetical protein
MFFGGLNLVHFFNLKIVIFTYTLKDFLCGEGGGGEMDLIHQISNKVEIKLPDFCNQKVE